MSNLGQRLRTIRTQKGFTQQQLELELDASFGHISKIESGKVNPTKETLLQISQILDLNQGETIVLLGINVEPVTPEEVQKAITHTADYLASSQYPVYLSDDLWFMWAANDVMLNMISVPTNPIARKQFITDHFGTNILQWLFNPGLGFKSMIPSNQWPEIALCHCIYFMYQTDCLVRIGQPWLEELLAKLRQCDQFETIWAEAEEQVLQGNFERHDFSFPIRIGNRETHVFLAESAVSSMPRFTLVEYLPQKK